MRIGADVAHLQQHQADFCLAFGEGEDSAVGGHCRIPARANELAGAVAAEVEGESVAGAGGAVKVQGVELGAAFGDLAGAGEGGFIEAGQRKGVAGVVTFFEGNAGLGVDLDAQVTLVQVLRIGQVEVVDGDGVAGVGALDDDQFLAGRSAGVVLDVQTDVQAAGLGRVAAFGAGAATQDILGATAVAPQRRRDRLNAFDTGQLLNDLLGRVVRNGVVQSFQAV